MKSKENLEEIRDKFQSLFEEKNENEGISHDAYMLMSGYLSEIEKTLSKEDLNKKILAERINISASYLTQVFRGDKPLNFITLAKIQRALKIRFKVESFYPAQIIAQRINSKKATDKSTGFVEENTVHKKWKVYYNPGLDKNTPITISA